MKLLISFCVLLISCKNLYPPREFEKANVSKYPFQVLYADNCNNASRGFELREGMELSTSDNITINNGHLILVHYSGKFLEFVNDTSFSLNKINTELKNQTTLDNKRYRPDIEFMFSSKEQGVVMDGAQGILLLIEQSATTDQHKEVCLQWTLRGVDRSPEKFIVRIRNIFDELLEEIETRSTSISIDLRKYPSEELFILDVRDSESSLISMIHGINIGKGSFLLPMNCQPQTAIEALEVAYHLERNHYSTEEAFPYYELAASLSDRQYYKDLLLMYKSRNRMK